MAYGKSNAFEEARKKAEARHAKNMEPPKSSAFEEARKQAQERARKSKASSVDQAYIDDYFTQANKFLAGYGGEEGHKRWAEKGSNYQSGYDEWKALSERGAIIETWLEMNKDSFDPESANEFRESLKRSRQYLSEALGQSYFNDFYSRSNSFLDGYDQDAGLNRWSTADADYQGRYDEWKDLDQRRAWIENWMGENPGVYTADIEQGLSDSMKEYRRYLSMMLGDYHNQKEYYGQWETEEDYNAHLDWKERVSADPAVLEKELAALKQQRDSYEYDWTDNQQRAQAELDLAEFDKLIRQKQAHIDEVNRYRTNLQYQELMGAEDFAEKSRYQSTANGKERTALQIMMDSYSAESSGWDDPLYEYINGNKEAGVYLSDMASTNYGPDNALGSFYGRSTENNAQSQQMTKDEVAIFNYLYATKGKEAAHAYYDHLQSNLNARQRAADEAYAREYAKKHQVLASTFSVLTSPLKGLSYVGQVSDYLDDGKFDQNAAYNKFSYNNSAIRGQVAKQIEESGKWGEVGSFAYQTGMSMGDFLMTTAVTGGNGTASMLIMGSGAAADTTIAAKDRGLSDEQAFQLGTVAGLSEALCERVSLGSLLNTDLLRNSAGKYILKNMITEGLEEVTTSGVNLMADILISKDQSEWQKSIDAYMKQNPDMSEEEAFVQAMTDQAAAMGMDFLGGFFSGGIMSAGSAITYRNNTNQIAEDLNKLDLSNEDIQSFIQEGLASDRKSDAYAVANEMQKKLAAGKKLTSTDISRLYQANVQEQPNAVWEDPEDEPQWVSLPTLEDADRDAAAREQPQQVADTGSDRNHRPGDVPEPMRDDRYGQGAGVREQDGTAEDTAVASEHMQQTKPAEKERPIFGSYTGIREIKRGRVLLDTPSGEVFDSSKMLSSWHEGIEMFQLVSRLRKSIDINTANQLVRALESHEREVRHASMRGMEQAYNYGYSGRSRSALESNETIARVPEAVRNILYDMGAQYRQQMKTGKTVGGTQGNAGQNVAVSQPTQATDPGREQQKEVHAQPEAVREDPVHEPEWISLPVPDQLNQEMNGGTTNGKTNGEAEGPAAAQPGGYAQQPGTGLLHGDGRRNDRAGAREQTGKLAGSPEQSRSNYADSSRAAIARQNYARSLRLEKISSRELGLQKGTETRSVQVMPREHWDNEMTELADRIYQETGKDVTYVIGRIQIRGSGDKVGYARGAVTGDRIIIQADHLQLPIEKIADHEAYHAKVDFSEGRLNNEIRRHIIETYSEEEFQQVLDQYIVGLRGVIDVSEASTREEFEAAVRAIEEELFADAYAGINAFGAGADRFTSAVNEKMDQLYMGKHRGQENGTEQPTGPPAERFSYAGENAETADLDALERAKEMQSAGVADETIRQQTGWFMGMDGKWRWEIDDSGMRYDSSGDLRGAESAKWAMEDFENAREDLWGRADLETLEKVRAYNRADIAGDDATKQELYDELVNGPHAYYFDQYVDAITRARDARNAPAGGTLQDYIDHPELFEAYPELRNVTMRFERMGGGNMGYYSRTDNEIVLNADLRYAAEDTLVHEIQHAIQKTEGFARGANEQYWQQRQDSDNAVKVYDNKIRDAEQKVSEILNSLPVNVAEQFRQWSTMDDATPEAMAIMDELLEGPYGDQFDDYWLLTLGAEDMRRTNYKRGPRDLYRNTAGEIEARDAAARRSLTSDQRRGTAPDLGNDMTVFTDETGISFDREISQYPYNMQTVIQEYLDAVDSDVLSFVEEVQQGNAWNGKKITVGNVSSEMAAEIARLTGNNASIGAPILLNTGAVEHILKRHGSQGQADQSMRNAQDIARINYVLQNFDSAELSDKRNFGYRNRDGSASQNVVFSKKINGTYFVIEAVPNTGKVGIVSAFISKKGASQVLDDNAPSSDVQNVPVSTPDKSIARQDKGVKKNAGRERYSIDESGVADVQEEKQAPKKPRPVAESRPILAKQKLRNNILNQFSIPGGQRAELGAMIDSYADRLIKNGCLTEEDRKSFFDRMYESGVMTVPANDYYAEARNYMKGGKVYVPDSVVQELGDDWNETRRRAFAAGIILTRSRENAGIDVWNSDLAADVPGLFDENETDLRTILDRIIQVAEEGRDEHLSLQEYTARLAGQGYTSEEEFLDTMERQFDWALRTFAENADLELQLRDRTGVKIAQERDRYDQKLARQRMQELQRRAEERQARKDSTKRAQNRKELQELQQRTLKQLQWLNKNRHRAPEELKEAFDEVLGDIDLYAVSAADEMRWSDKHNATWKDLAQMYKDAMKNDPNFLPSKELERIVTRLDATKIADMDLGALQDLYKAAIGLRTEFYNRNNVINDEMQRLFAEVYTDAKQEIESAPGGFTGKFMDKFLNMEQLTPMNILQRMAGWDPNSSFYSMAKQLERGERDIRAYSVKAQKMLQGFLTEHEDWVKIADGQGKDAIWYEVEVPQLLELGMGDKPIFGPTVTVYMTPAQKVHMYLESKNLDNLRHMTGGRTFVDKELYSQGKRQEALSQGRTIRLAPETVRKIVSDLTPEEMELANLLDRYYNTFATQEINRVSNILYGYDKAMGKNYAPIYTNRNYTKTEFGVFDTTAEGVGNLKGRQYAVNPSYNISAFDAFERHVDQTARFCGMAIPARNWTTLMNWREKNNSTGDVITHKWGEEGKRYISDLITTLQSGDDAKTDTVSSALSRLQSNYISAVFGANPSIVLKQLGSIPLAGAYLGPRNLPTPVQLARIDRDLITKYTQELEWRTMGYTTPETKQLKDNPNWTQTNKAVKFLFGGGAITAMDGWAASTLWPWAENKVRREYPELEVGTQEQIDKGESAFYKKVAEEFENALSRSQSVSDEIHQGTLRKSKNPITRAFTLFRSDSAQTYNALRQTIGEAGYYSRQKKAANDRLAKKEITREQYDSIVKPIDEALKPAKRAAGTAFVALAINALWAEGVSFLMALWKNKGKYYRDDEEELTADSVIGEMVSNVLGSFAGVVTGGEELFEVIGNILTGEKWYGIETPGMEQLNDLVDVLADAGSGMRDLVAGGWDILKNGGDLGKYLGKHSGEILGSVKDLAMAAAMYLPGLPASNLEGYFMGAVKWFSPELGATYDDLFRDVGKSDLAGSEGDVLESRIGGILEDRSISDSDETAQALTDLYAAGYKEAVPSDTPTSVSIDGEKRSLGAYQQQAYDSIWGSIVADGLDEMVTSDSFREADAETQSKMLSNLYAYAAERTKAELFDEYEMDSGTEKNAAIVAAGATVAECITWNVITSEMNSGEKAMELASWNIPEKTKREIFVNKISDSREDSIAAFDGAGLSFNQFLRAYSMYGQINNKDIKATSKAVEFSHWVNAQGYTDQQAAVVKDELTYFSMTPASSNRYDKLVESGMDPDDAYDLTGELGELQPEEGEDQVSDLQKWRTCVDFSDNVDDQLTALFAVMTEAQYQKVEIANDFGVTPDAYVTLQEIKVQYDSDGNGAYKNSEIQDAIDALPGKYTDEQKAVLWQLATGSKSAKNNPYSREVGQRVLDAKEAVKGEDEEEPVLEGLSLGNW